MFYVSTGSALNLLFCEMCLLEHRGGYEQRQCPLPWKKAYPYQRHFSLFPACWDILHWKSHSEICKVHVLCEWEGEKNGNNRARWKKKWENAKLKYANKVVAKKKKKNQSTTPQRKGGMGGGRKEDGEPCLPPPSQPVLWIYKKDINYEDPNSNVPKHLFFWGISFWAIQIPERPDQSDRALTGFIHTDAVHSARVGPAGTSAWLLSALQKEGGLGWIWAVMLASGKY